MATKIFTSESLTTFINEIKTYISNAISTKANISHNHVISNIDGLQSALDSKAASGHTHSDVYTETEVDTLLSGKANTSHTHSISNITNLQSVLDGKASTSHGTHVSYSTTAPVMDGSASVGTASTVARSDHKHPTDTSRAAQTSLDSHTSNKSNPHGVTLAQLGVTTTATELNALDGITATVTELNYVDGVTSNIQTQLNGKAASSHTHTIANITNLQTTLDGKAASSHTHKVANITDLTATATELNYMDGVTSNVQTQLDGKAASSHNHSATNITSGTLSSDRLPTVPISKGGTGATTAADVLTNLGITATASELNYVDGVTSNIQTQLNGKASSSHTHNYAGSSSAGGDANNALKLQGYTRNNLYADISTWIQTVGLTHTITVEGNKDTYYPVRIYLSSSKTMPTYVSIHKNLGTATPSIDGNHSNGSSSMWLIYEGRNRSWDGNGGYLKTLYRYMGYADLCSHTDIGTSVVGDLIVWLRGGGCVYNVSATNSSTAPSIYYQETNLGTETYPYNVAPRTDLGNKGIYRGLLGYGNIDGNASTATNVAWSGVTSKPSYYDAKAIKSITRNGTTFTYTCMDGTTGTFTQQDNNTTYGVATTSSNGLMSSSDKSKLDGMVLATVSEVETYLSI